MPLTPYLFFNGRCDEALQFYKEAIGAKVDALMRYKEAPDQSQIAPEQKEKVMHSAFHIGDAQLFASDGHCTGTLQFEGFGLALNARDVAEAGKLFEALGEGGQVKAPLSETFFAKSFGVVDDKFGVTWMVLAYDD
ncbi:hypothetical protein A7A08_03135 [Methyloligella halotolerans]|uniref:PhnB-like domain-containing protein n=1 Tax=Methyloligella halotolerans TaxID=1177755 RepID=A0A1E2RUV8_9HYPH|nr:VOC family protein [Methyloligella halotolerans]ODA65991.1 hypothetical protein A7A08_03135 [Methyloligella halotolerans]